MVLILILLIVAVMSVVGTYLLSSISSFYVEDFGRQMQAVFTVEFFETLQTEAAKEDGVQKMEEILYAYTGNLGLGAERSLYILDGKNGTCLTGIGSDISAEGMPTLEYTKNMSEALLGRVGIGNSMVDPLIDFAAPIDAGQKQYVIYIKDTKDGLSSLTWMMFGILIQSILFGLGIAVLLSFLLSKTITNPIEKLTKSAKKLAEGSFDQPITTTAKDELGTLTSTFNSMATALKETLATVEAEKNKLSTLLVNMTDGVAAFDREGTLLIMNPTAKAQLSVHSDKGYSFRELFGMLDTTWDEVRELQSPTILQFAAQVGETSLKVYIAPFGGGGDGIIAVIHDITEETRLDDARREFVANVSHELRTPLTNVKSYAETMLDDSEIPEAMEKRFLKVILNETDRMTRIVKDLLTLSRFDYSKMDWSYTAFSPLAVLEDIIDAMYKDAERHGHTLTLHIKETLPNAYIGDRERIEQVLINIISNAMKYTPDHGKIDVNATVEEEQMVISVVDNGIGIPAEDLPRLFERFYRVDKARSREKGGTGLGLSIAKEIVEHHKGEISVSSVFEEGTAIEIRLPINAMKLAAE